MNAGDSPLISDVLPVIEVFGYLIVAEAYNGAPLGIDANDCDSVKSAFDRYVRPEVDRWTPVDRARLQRCLRCVIKGPAAIGDKALRSIQDVSMTEAADSTQFFIWLWDAIFPDIKYE